MRTKFILSMLIMTAVASTFGFKEANAGLPGLPGLPAPNVNVSINGFLPAPPGVTIQFYSGRPYYVERGHRVYLKEKKHDKHHKGHGHKYGHYKQK
jgi:hypothetical protein